MKTVAVVIPIYKTTLQAEEEMSLRQCIKVLAAHPILFVAPETLDTSFLSPFIGNINVIRFPDEYFKSTKTYNQLLVSVSFYKAFTAFDFILIYQLDAYVFKDELLAWCEKEYDYIGAPKLKKQHWENPENVTLSYFDKIIYNGGLSLRRIKPIIRLLRLYHFFYPAWPANEDSLFSFGERRIYPFRFMLRLPHWKEAMRFAVEKNPQIAMKLLEDELPFGCHAWEKYNPNFWKKYIA